MRFSACNLLLREQLKIGRKKKLSQWIRLPCHKLKHFFFRSEENVKKQITPYCIIYYLASDTLGSEFC